MFIIETSSTQSYGLPTLPVLFLLEERWDSFFNWIGEVLWHLYSSKQTHIEYGCVRWFREWAISSLTDRWRSEHKKASCRAITRVFTEGCKRIPRLILFLLLLLPRVAVAIFQVLFGLSCELPPLRPDIFINPWQPPTLGREWLLHTKEDKEGSVLTLIVRLSKSAGIHLLLGRASIVYRDFKIFRIYPFPIVVDPTIWCMWGCPPDWGREKKKRGSSGPEKI